MADDARMQMSRRPFVGREREMDELASGLDEAVAGRGGLFLLVGAPGIGKTRLADEGARAAEARGLRPLWGRCWETGGAPAYWPFIQVLRELVRPPGGPALLEELGPARRRLAPLLPEVAGEPEEAGDPVQARFRLFEASVELLRAGGRQTPLYVVLDDLHAADPSSLALLHFLARNLRGLRALIVGTYREEEARLAPEVGRMLTDVAREGAYLPLAPLGRGEIEALVASAGGRPPEASLVSAVERATEGNPLFLSELLRLLAARGELAQARDPATLPIPDTVREVIGRRVARLDAGARAVLGPASVVGRDFTTGLLVQIGCGAAPDLERRLDDVERAGLVLPTGPGAWRFSHVLVREALYRELPAAARAQAHQQVAAALEASGAGQGAAAEIAHHLLAALPAGDPLTAAAAARRAADRAMAMLAFEDAAMLLGRTRAALQAAPQPDARLLCELRLQEGLAWQRAGDAERGRAACLAAADEARRLGAGDLLARAALGYGAELILALTDAKLVALLEEALAALPPGPSGWRAQVLARLAAALQPADDVQGPMAMAREAIAMARGLGDPEILRTVLLFGGAALADYAPPAERAEVSEELVRLASEAGDRFQLLRAHSRLVFDWLELGAVDRSARAVDAYEAVAREFKQPRHLWPALLMRSMLASAAGRPAEAAKHHQDAAALADGDPDPTVPFVFAWCRLGHALENERVDELAAAEEQLARILAHPGLPSIPTDLINLALAMSYARQDRLDEARRRMALIDFRGRILRNDRTLGATLAEAVLATGDAELAAQHLRRLRPMAGLLLSHGRTGMTCGGPIDQALGVLALGCGQPDEAVRHIEAGLALAARAGLPPYVASGKYWLARALRARGAPGDEVRARAMAAEARELARSLGLVLLLGRLERLAAPAPATPAAPLRPPFTLRREGEFWTVSDGDAVCRLKDGRGVQMLAELIAQPGREFHVLALSGPGSEEVDGGDAGEVLDAEAIADYRARVEELDDELAEAERWGDTARAARARGEREAIGRALAEGVGLGGRGRRAGAAAERARTNVQRRIRGAIRKIAESMPALGAYLDRTVRTGTFCSYEPL